MARDIILARRAAFIAAALASASACSGQGPPQPCLSPLGGHGGTGGVDASDDVNTSGGTAGASGAGGVDASDDANASGGSAGTLDASDE